MTVGRPILVTSIVLAAGFSVLLLSEFRFTQTLGLLIGLTVIGAVLADLILLPAMLVFFRNTRREVSEDQ